MEVSGTSVLTNTIQFPFHVCGHLSRPHGVAMVDYERVRVHNVQRSRVTVDLVPEESLLQHAITLHLHGLKGAATRLTFDEGTAEDETMTSHPARTQHQRKCTAPMAGRYSDVLVEHEAYMKTYGPRLRCWSY